ncbi:ABC transporter ATP-binding protein [Chitinimonas sp. BJB300]|uniref:ABC transporter ATP-binding protein n=1 Tax=Chitinimonas sp. BJB300 TaxID=1559339 RepID=UPI000C0D2639|nr:ABC transporter ATP-binding protein [Chitinimonas sp. BJB300]PHV11524.1 cobalamin ABC transporter ATP-binding protein [Chitinimonas sp. BJB300]TSJ91379.1 ABC transporter ATP-binding protein [Chitinimonas sp. BJB300]
MSLLATNQLSIRQGQRTLCHALDINIKPGECWLVLGENGCGKSTLLAALAGWHAPQAGKINLHDKPLPSWTSQERAKRMAWLTQQDDSAFPLTVLEKALTGRHPHLGRWDWESTDDIALAQHQLARLDLVNLAGRDLATLSGGERRRASLAAVLAQQAELLLLDEPLSQLDLRHQQQALAILRDETNAGRSLVLVSHDPNHAHGFASHVLLLFGDGRWLAGPVQETLTEANLSALYRHPVRSHLVDGQPWFLPGPHVA